jgi:hypothetical protein
MIDLSAASYPGASLAQNRQGDCAHNGSNEAEMTVAAIADEIQASA